MGYEKRNPDKLMRLEVRAPRNRRLNFTANVAKLMKLISSQSKIDPTRL